MPAGSVEPKDRCGTGECAGVCSGVTQYSNGFPFSACTFPPARTCGGGVTCSNGQVTGGGTCATNGPTCVAGSPTPAPCGGGLGCADPTHCKPACTSAADCQTPNQVCAPDGKSCIPDGKVCHSNGECPKFNDCASDGMSCKPDAVLAAATARGVVPSTWEPPQLRTPAEVATELKDAGYTQDEQGRILFDAFAPGGIVPMFDPNAKTPLLGLRSCVYRLLACSVATGDLDACTAGNPRCEGSTPWLGDAAGVDCCPDECLMEYFEARATEPTFESVRKVINGTCYPGLRQYFEGLSQ